MCKAFEPANEASEKKRTFFQKKTEKLGMRKNEGATLKFANIPSDAISPNEMHEVSSACTSKSIRNLRKKHGQIRNNEGADVENNISKAYVAEPENDDIAILPNGVVTVVGQNQ